MVMDFLYAFSSYGPFSFAGRTCAGAYLEDNDPTLNYAVKQTRIVAAKIIFDFVFAVLFTIGSISVQEATKVKPDKPDYGELAVADESDEEGDEGKGEGEVAPI